MGLLVIIVPSMSPGSTILPFGPRSSFDLSRLFRLKTFWFTLAARPGSRGNPRKIMSEGNTVETIVECDLKDRSIEEFEEALVDIIGEISDDPMAIKFFRDREIDPHSLAKVEPANNIKVNVAPRQGLATGVTLLILKFALPIASKIVLDLWTEVILPRLKQRLGTTSVKTTAK